MLEKSGEYTYQSQAYAWRAPLPGLAGQIARLSLWEKIKLFMGWGERPTSLVIKFKIEPKETMLPDGGKGVDLRVTERSVILDH